MRTTAGCPSDFALERFLLGELPSDGRDVVDHVGFCPTCRAKVRAKEADNTDFAGSPGATRVRGALLSSEASHRSYEVDEGADRRPHRRAARRLVGAGVAAALALALGLVLMRHRAPSPAPISAAETNDEQVVLRVQREWMEAIRDRDSAVLERILADDYTFTDSRGGVANKSDSLRQAESGNDRMRAFHTSDERARVYGNTAVITGRLRVEGVAGGQAYDAEVRFTDILARIDGQWRAVAAHTSRQAR